jgi:hypothetical protein
MMSARREVRTRTLILSIECKSDVAKALQRIMEIWEWEK